MPGDRWERQRFRGKRVLRDLEASSKHAGPNHEFATSDQENSGPRYEFNSSRYSEKDIKRLVREADTQLYSTGIFEQFE
jgi:hypothetical protein